LIEERYGRQVDLVIDGGMGQIEASTVIDCTVDEPIVVRQGLGEVDF
jgi:tRNA A37 threonylcarbamoyladenosine synthetase subunit TsaC/SUA5/YrdC